jgi:hypothetical protein
MVNLIGLLHPWKLSQEHELLLKAACLQGEAAITAWQQWKPMIDIENLDPAAYSLLPQLYQNLLSHDLEDAHMARLKGIYRRTWYSNQLQIKQLDFLLKALNNMGIEVIILGDAALSACYRDCGVRQISSFNLLVAPQHLEQAVNVLATLGWNSISGANALPKLSAHLQNQQQQSLWVQVHLFWAIPQDKTDELVWAQASCSEDGGKRRQTLSPVDQFLDICQRAFIQGQTDQIQGIADALMLVRASHSLDWKHLLEQAQNYQLIVPTSNMLMLLVSLFQVALPNWVMPTCQDMSITAEEWFKYQIWVGNQPCLSQSMVFHLTRPLRRLKSLGSRLRRFLQTNLPAAPPSIPPW